jgi:PAS domain-containing protein
LPARNSSDTPFIIWEGDPATFQFSYVGGDAEQLLGYPAGDWITSPTFWTSTVIHSDDREEAVAYCALATALCRDHVFEYRALTREFDMIWLKDYVHVVLGPRGRPISLRGIMVDISEEKWRAGTFLKASSFRSPTTAELQGIAG